MLRSGAWQKLTRDLCHYYETITEDVECFKVMKLLNCVYINLHTTYYRMCALLGYN